MIAFTCQPNPNMLLKAFPLYVCACVACERGKRAGEKEKKRKGKGGSEGGRHLPRAPKAQAGAGRVI